MKRRLLTAAALFFALIALSVLPAAAEGTRGGCTGLIAGKGTTTDGSILFAKTEDDTPEQIDYLWYIPRRHHPPGSVVKLESGGSIPQVEETYAFFWDQAPGTSFSNNVVNEWGLSLGSNACPSREDSVEAVEARGDLVQGGLGFELRIILAERARTAREAVLLAAELLDAYGYRASGRCLHVVGPDGAWLLQMVRGKQYVARRVPDGEAAIIANTYNIREVDRNDRENFVCSPHLVEYAIERGWYDPAGGKPFDFAAAYAAPWAYANPGNTDRQWDMARLLVRSFPMSWQQARKGMLPFSVKPDRKLSVREIAAIFRDHFEGTTLDSTDSYRISPHRSPVRSICCDASHRTTIIQQRDWMPPEIGTVVWRALEPPCLSVFVPWYLGITRIPAAFQAAPERADTTHFDRLFYHFALPGTSTVGTTTVYAAPGSAASGAAAAGAGGVTTAAAVPEASGDVFKLLGNLVDENYRERIGRVGKVWEDFEAEEYAMQPAVEETALRLFEQDTALAREFLTLYSNALAEKSLGTAKVLIGEMRPAGK